MTVTNTLGRFARCCPRRFCIVLALSAMPGLWAQEPVITTEAAMTLALIPAPVAVAPSNPGGTYVPLSRHERWHGFLHETFLGTQPALQIFGTAFLDHLGHAPVQWGVGLHGYAHRLENRFFSTMIDGSVHYGLAALLRQDTRYLPSRDRRAVHRMGHALQRTLFTYNQAGERVFDVSGLAGNYAGTMIPMLWHPRGYSPFGQGLRTGNFGVMFTAGTNVLKEFRPDLQRLFAKK
jgi:hypothetical protein